MVMILHSAGFPDLKSHMQENKGGAGKINIGTISPPPEFSLIPEMSTGTAPPLLVLENGITTLGLTPFSRVC